jgi:acetylornithine/succinyldiaminopimelate/putrescine aminotransferase/predicted amino acid dehydrogenase
MDGPLNPTLHRLLAACGLDRTWTRGEGVWLFDEESGAFLDCYAQYGAVVLGHNAPPVVAAVRAALDASEPAMVQPYRAPHAAALAEELTRLVPGMARCVFTTSGTETVEAAIKLVRAKSGRPVILSAEGSFHGKTLAALAATGQSQHSEGFGPLPSGFEHLPFGDAKALAARLQSGKDVAAVLMEPIQGERGVHLPPPGYLGQVRELCTRHGVALILDEIQTGLGRTGRLFDCEHEAITPDLLLLAKGLGGGLFPLGACLSSADWWDDGFGLRHSSTFANNNIACRVGLAVLETLTSDGFLADVARKGERLLAGLRRLAERFPSVIAAVRGRGLLAAIELRPASPHADDGIFLSFLSNHGLYAYAVAAVLAEEASILALPTLGESPVLRLAPPLVICDEELELALDGIEQVCARLEWNATATLAESLNTLENVKIERAGEIGAKRKAESGTALFLPAPLCHANGRPSYVFLTHPTRLEDLALTNPGLERVTPEELRRFGAFLAELPPLVVMRTPAVRSATGASVDGFILGIPWLPEEMARRGPRQVSDAIVRAVDLAARCGVQVVGLGGHTTSFSRRGETVLGRGPAVTTGNALTAGMAFAGTQQAIEERGVNLADASVGIVGARGSVGGLCARLFARARPRRLLLIGNPTNGNGGLERFGYELQWSPGSIAVTTDLARLEECDVVVTATGASRPILDDLTLTPGTIVCDVARPPDTSPRLRARPDILVFDGGLVSLPDSGIRFGAGNLVGLPDGVQLACLSETILLTLEGDRRDHGIGDDVSLAEVDYMMALAERHGFRRLAATRSLRSGALPSDAIRSEDFASRLTQNSLAE